MFSAQWGPVLIASLRIFTYALAASGRFTPVDTESRDGQGRTALWHAVNGGHTALVAALVEEGGARVFYPDGDLSCPLQQACRSIGQLGRKVS